MLLNNSRNPIYLIIVFLLLISCANLKTLKDYYVTDKINISKEQVLRLQNYLSGEIFSYEIGRYVDAYPLAFLISEDGVKSVILGCEGRNDDCNTHVRIFQLIQKYNKKENSNFKILALKRKILVSSLNSTDQSLEKKFIKIAKNSKIYFDKILIPTDACNDEDC